LRRMRIFCPATRAVLLLSRFPALVADPGMPASCRTHAVFTLLSIAAGCPAAIAARGCTHAFMSSRVSRACPARRACPAGRRRRAQSARQPARSRRADVRPPPLFICPGSPVHAVGRVALTAHASAPESLADAGGPAALGLSATIAVSCWSYWLSPAIHRFLDHRGDQLRRCAAACPGPREGTTPPEGNPRSMPHWASRVQVG